MDEAARRQERVTALGLFAIALVLRGGVILKASGVVSDVLPLDRSSAFWPPLPWLMAHAVTAALGTTSLALLLYAAIASLAAPVVFRLGREVGLGTAGAGFAGLTAAALPYYVGTAALQPPTGISILLTATLTLAVVRAARAPGATPLVAVAATLVLAMADRPNVLSYVVYLLAAACVSGRAPRRRLALVVTAAIFLYSAGRMVAYGRFTPFTANGGYNLVLGHNPWVADYLGRHDVPSLEQIAVDHPGLIQPADDTFLRARALAFAGAHPAQTLVNTARKALRYWDVRLENADRFPRSKNLAYTVPYVALLALAAIGVGAAFTGALPWRLVLLPLLGWLAYALPSLLTLPLIRMRMYSEFLLFLAAGVGVEALRDLTRGRSAWSPWANQTHGKHSEFR